MGDFAADTAIEGGNGNYRARLSADWEIWGPNGGYVAAIALRAAGAATPLRRPASFAGHFLSVAAFDAVDLRVTPLREGKRAASLRVSMTQQGRAIFEAIVWVIDEVDGLVHDTARPPAVPSPEELRPIEDLLPPGEKRSYPFWQNLESRPIDFVHWSQRQVGEPVWREWYRFRPRATFPEDPFVDAARALLLIDTMTWPAAARPHPIDAPFIAPSLDVTAQFHRAAPTAEWLLCDTVAPVGAHGLMGGQARIWSEDGQLLASGTSQLMCRPRPVL